MQASATIVATQREGFYFTRESWESLPRLPLSAYFQGFANLQTV